MRIFTKQYSRRGPWYWFVQTSSGRVIAGMMRYINKQRAWRAARNYVKRNQSTVFNRSY